MCAMVCMWRLEDNPKNSAPPSFHYMGPRDWTRVVGPGAQHLQQLSFLNSSVTYAYGVRWSTGVFCRLAYILNTADLKNRKKSLCFKIIVLSSGLTSFDNM